jgi:hypothetical protein
MVYVPLFRLTGYKEIPTLLGSRVEIMGAEPTDGI